MSILISILIATSYLACTPSCEAKLFKQDHSRFLYQDVSLRDEERIKADKEDEALDIGSPRLISRSFTFGKKSDFPNKELQKSAESKTSEKEVAHTAEAEEILDFDY